MDDSATLQLPATPEYVPGNLSLSPDRPDRRRITPTAVDCAVVNPVFKNAGYAFWPGNLPPPLASTAFMNWMFLGMTGTSSSAPIVIE
jgi:hypothetical protein